MPAASWLMNLGFAAGAVTAEVVTPDAGAGSSKRKRQRKYPRWVVIEGQRFRVNSPEEERALLQAMLERAQTQAEAAPPAQAKVATRKAIRIAKRLETVDDSEAMWLQRLREMDEELLILVH